MTLYALAFAVFAVAALAQAVSGFGFALVSIPLLTILTQPGTALVAVAIVALPMTVGIFVVERAHVSWRPVWQLVIPAALAMPIGLVVLLTVPEAAMTAAIAVVVVGCTVLVWREWRFTGSAARVCAAGVFSGVLSTTTGTNGPALVATLQGMGFPPRPFRATLAAVFAVNGAISLIAFGAAGVVTARSAALAAIGLPAIAAGGWLGNRLFSRIDAARFRRVLIAGLIASSTVALAHAGAGAW